VNLGSRETAGLPVWTAKNRAVRRTDIVLWVNVSLNHLTRAEDQPVMPTLRHSFKVRPFNFLDRNPALDLRSEPSAPMSPAAQPAAARPPRGE
jgi:primary-amine oxidase